MKEKHILIISGPMGNGHVQAAAGIEGWAKKDFPEYKVTNINIADVMFKPFSLFYSKVYNFLINHYPQGWQNIYNRNDSPNRHSLIRKIGSYFRIFTARPLLKVIKKLQPDYIISTHFLPPELLNREKLKGRINIPVASVVTDFSLNRIYVQPAMDYFFVASNELKFRLIAEGIAEEKIHVSGIPVKPEFATHLSPEQLEEQKKEFNLPLDKTIIMLMMGGASTGNLEKITKLLVSKFPDFVFMVLPGKNKTLLKRMQELQEEYPQNLYPVPFTTEVWRYLAVSNLVISKPGGISTSECLAMRKPVIIIYPIPGQEERNADYLLERSVASKAYDEISLLYKDVLLDEKRIHYMLTQIHEIRKPRAGYEIIKTVLGK